MATGNQSQPHSPATLDVELNFRGDLWVIYLSPCQESAWSHSWAWQGRQQGDWQAHPLSFPHLWLAVGEDRSASHGHYEDLRMEEGA